MTEVKRFPAEWERMDNIVVLDPDGWRHDNKLWCEPITRNEWIRRKNMSTIKYVKEKTEMTNTNTTSTTEYYQRAITILEELDGDTRAKAKMLVEIAKHSPKTLVKVYDETHGPIARNKQHYNAVNRVFDGNNKIACIKEYRALSGEGLKEAKVWVEKNFTFNQF